MLLKQGGFGGGGGDVGEKDIRETGTATRPAAEEVSQSRKPHSVGLPPDPPIS